MPKYNFGENEQDLLAQNILGIDNLEQLEKAEQFVFSIRALEFEVGIYTIKGLTMEGLLDLHRHLFQDIY
ncbi:hypothetical protein [Rummeliibacillus sp. SL167]|uniref:hypothetical protein n=1 Tax=Rummeliibacillus sp. SL167 TaxID=2579792 RepID=UPI0011B5F8F1|nr:hypothetical protein [Rummeliibacillus sp. SL167]